MVMLLVSGPLMVLLLVLGWRFFLNADKRELEEHERAQRALTDSDSRREPRP